nr:phage minor tail protein G [Escherichia coli]
MGSCAAPSAKGDDKFITTDYLQQCPFLRMGMDINAWLVSRSLWNADQSKDVETLCASVITTWSYDALGAGAEMVLSLSGMGAIDNAGDDEHEALTPEKS